jgi:hypothetical protein
MYKICRGQMYVIRELRLEVKRPIDRSNIDNSVVVNERFFMLLLHALKEAFLLPERRSVCFTKFVI